MVSVTVASAVASFALVAGMLTVVPGLDTALVLRSAVNSGRKHAFATALGINTGTLVWGVAAAVGISALLTASQSAYTVVKLAGAAYMGWLGCRILWQLCQSRRDLPADPTIDDPSPVRPMPGGVVRAWLTGLGTNLLNPKVGAFYVAMLPQFVPPETSHLAMGALLAVVHNAEGLAWFTLLILSTHLVRSWLAKRAVRRAVDAVTGTVLVAFGVKLALSHR